MGNKKPKVRLERQGKTMAMRQIQGHEQRKRVPNEHLCSGNSEQIFIFINFFLEDMKMG